MNVCASYVTDVKGTVALALEGFSFVSTLWCLVAMWFGMRGMFCRRLNQ